MDRAYRRMVRAFAPGIVTGIGLGWHSRCQVSEQVRLTALMGLCYTPRKAEIGKSSRQSGFQRAEKR